MILEPHAPLTKAGKLRNPAILHTCVVWGGFMVHKGWRTFKLQVVGLLVGLAFGSPLLFANERTDCAQYLSSYQKQRAGADPELVKDVRAYGHKIRTELLQTNLGRLVTGLVHDLKPYEPDRTKQKLDEKNELIVRQASYDGTWQVLLSNKDEDKPQVLLNSHDVSTVPEVVYENLKLSPDKRYFALQYREYGSIDNGFVLIFNLDDRRIVKRLPCGYEFSWSSPERLIFEDARQGEATQYGLRIFDVEHDQVFVWSRVGQINSAFENWVSVAKGSQTVLLNGGHEYELPQDFSSGQIFGADDRYLYFNSSQSTWSNRKIVRLEIESLNKADLVYKDLVSENAYRITDSAFKDGYLFLERTFGEHQDVAIYAANGDFVDSIEIPFGAVVKKWSWGEVGKSIDLWLSNPIHNSLKLTYDLTKKAFDQDVKKLLLRDPNGNSYKSCVITANGADGVKIPIRLFYQQLGEGDSCEDFQQGKVRPVLLQSYGGFFVEGYFRLGFNHMYKEFMRRGGILAGPALRGGGEYNESWHQAGALRAKANTLYDLISSAEELIRRGITRPELISSMGTSNGGFVVAAATSLRPDLFGLTIPINGVLDWGNTKNLDAAFLGWKSEYGDTEKVDFSELRTKYSPVALAKNTRYQNLLVVTGLNDSRVNPLHSHNFIVAVHGGPTSEENVNWLAVKNTGHWGEALYRQGHSAKFIEASIWTAIFRQSGFSD